MPVMTMTIGAERERCMQWDWNWNQSLQTPAGLAVPKEDRGIFFRKILANIG